MPNVRVSMIYAALICCAALLGHAPTAAQPADTAQAYRVYTGAGTPATLRNVAEAMGDHVVVFVGETHDDPTAHELQLELLQQAARRYGSASDSAQGRPVVLSMEMFERDVQPVLDEYLRGLITEEHFLKSSRPWDNYASAYRPLVEFAKAHALSVLAANAPRRYVNRVAREGSASLHALSPSAQKWLPPLPYADPSSAYRAKWIDAMQEAPEDSTGESPDASSADTTEHGAGRTAPHGHAEAMRNMLQAQALWDATMAYSLVQRLLRQPQALILHLAGAFHVSEGAGIPEHLARYRPGTPVLTVIIQPVDDITAFKPGEHGRLGDFVILTDASRVPSRSSDSF